MAWSTPTWVSEGYPGQEGENEGDITVLDSGIVIVGSFSNDTFGLTLWAVTVSGSEVTVGPMHFDSSDVDWTGISGYESLGGPDPLGQVMDNLNFVTPLGDYTFGVTGRSSATYDSDGTPNPSGDHVAYVAIYEVDPGSLAITRTHVCVTPSVDLYADESTTSRWETDKFAQLSQVATTTQNVGIVHADGTLDVYEAEWPGRSSTRNGPIVVSGDTALIYADDPSPGLATFDLNGGFLDLLLTTALTGDDWSWAIFGCPLGDGKVAMVCSGADDSGSTDVDLPVKLAVINLDPLGVDAVYDIAASGEAIGWTGGWFSNVRAVNPYGDGRNLLISYAVGHVIYPVVLDTLTGIPTPLEPAPFETFGGSTYVARTAVLPGNGIIAMSIVTRDNFFGTYIAVLNEQPTIEGGLGPQRTRFIE